MRASGWFGRWRNSAATAPGAPSSTAGFQLGQPLLGDGQILGEAGMAGIVLGEASGDGQALPVASYRLRSRPSQLGYAAELVVSDGKVALGLGAGWAAIWPTAAFLRFLLGGQMSMNPSCFWMRGIG